jgi:ABC-2 type transport system permease protein
VIARETRVVGALAERVLIVQRRRAQLLLPTFLLPLLLLAVIASGTSAGRGLRGFPDVSSYLAFVVPGTVTQGTLLAGLTAGIMMAADVEFGFFDRLLTAPVHRSSIVLGRLVGVLVLSVLQTIWFLGIAMLFGARYGGGVPGVLGAICLAAITASSRIGSMNVGSSSCARRRWTIRTRWASAPTSRPITRAPPPSRPPGASR